MNSKTLAMLVAITSIIFAVSPLATIGFNGFTAAQFPLPQVDPPVQPAGYAFSIWGVIYAWLIIGAVYGALRAGSNPEWRAMRPPLLASLAIGSFWIAAANASPLLATVMIIVMAVTAIIAMLRAGHTQPWVQARPVALYAGWLTAATGVSIGVFLGGYGIVSSQIAAFICIIGVLVVALTVQSRRPREWAYPVAIIWALIGVIVANLPSSNWPVITLAILGIAALSLRAIQPLMKEVKA